MPNFLDCPNQILHHIVNGVPRFDLLSLALCNKSIYVFTEGALKEHLALCERYNTLTFGTYCDGFIDHSCDDTKSAVSFLGHVVKDPEIEGCLKIVRIPRSRLAQAPTLQPLQKCFRMKSLPLGFSSVHQRHRLFYPLPKECI